MIKIFSKVGIIQKEIEEKKTVFHHGATFLSFRFHVFFSKAVHALSADFVQVMNIRFSFYFVSKNSLIIIQWSILYPV